MAKSISKDFPLDENLFSKVLSSRGKYNSSKHGDASFRASYYGDTAGSVPFLWESQPGTPKHSLSVNPIVPLTPPPSYKSSLGRQNTPEKKRSKNSNFIQSIFPRVSSKKVPISPSSSSSSSSFSSAYSAPSSPWMNYKARSCSAVPFSLEEEDPVRGSPTSTLCFGAGNGSSRKSRCYFYPKSMKRVVLSIVGHGKGN